MGLNLKNAHFSCYVSIIRYKVKENINIQFV